ncbi:Cupin domain-containing protein, partial [Dysosmobacter welbionis]
EFPELPLGVIDIVLHPIKNVFTEALAAPFLCLVQTGRVPFQIYMNQPFLLFPEGLDAIQPQRIITGVDGVILPLPGDQLIPQPFVQCFIHLILIIRLVLDDLVRGTAAGCVL